MSCPKCNDTGVMKALGGIARDGVFRIYCCCEAGHPECWIYHPELKVAKPPIVPPTDDIVRE